MTARENPGSRHVRLILDECMDLLKDRGESRLNADAKILLAAILFADSEGVAHLEGGQLARWCGSPTYAKAGRSFLKRRIDFLIEVGLLAPGSTLVELRSMVGRSAYGEVEEVEEVAATDQTIADTGLTELELRAWFAGWEEAYFIRSGAPEETRRMVASTRGEATMEQILDLWEQTRLEAQ